MNADDETATLLGVLNALRDAVVAKVSGVPEPQVRTAGVPSGTNLLGLVKHLTYVERFYFLGEPISSLRRSMRPTARETVEGVIAGYRDAAAQADRTIGGYDDLAQPVTFLIVPSRGLLGRPAWYGLLPLSLMIRGVLPPGRVASADR